MSQCIIIPINTVYSRSSPLVPLTARKWRCLKIFEDEGCWESRGVKQLINQTTLSLLWLLTGAIKLRRGYSAVLCVCVCVCVCLGSPSELRSIWIPHPGPAGCHPVLFCVSQHVCSRRTRSDWGFMVSSFELWWWRRRQVTGPKIYCLFAPIRMTNSRSTWQKLP